MKRTLYLILLVLLTSCNKEGDLTAEQLLTSSDWEVISTVQLEGIEVGNFGLLRPPGILRFSPDQRLFEVYTMGGDLMIELGSWEVFENQKMRLNNSMIEIKKLSYQHFIYIQEVVSGNQTYHYEITREARSN